MDVPVFVATFGQAPGLWQRCLEQRLIVIASDEWIGQAPTTADPDEDRAQVAADAVVTRALAARWTAMDAWLRDTRDGLWLHWEADRLWWSRAIGETPEKAVVGDGLRGRSSQTYIYSQRCSGWSDRDQRGHPLLRSSIDSRIQDALLPRGDLQRPSPLDAERARALIEGQSNGAG